MLAYVSAPDTDDGYELREIPPPEPRADEALVEVRAFSLNRGDISQVRTLVPGTPLGWDLAGVVVRAAADGSGPPEGSRAFGCSFGRGSWARYNAVSTASLALLPDQVSFAAGSTLGVAGLTAVYALRYGGYLLGRTVIVTGAAGGVGRLAVQLAAASGARVIGVVSDAPDRAAAVAELGLGVDIEKGLSPTGVPADLILESVGGDSLTAAFTRIAPGGTIVTYGRSSGQPGRVPPAWFFGDAYLKGLAVATEMDRDHSGPQMLSGLAELVGRGRLDPGVSLEAGWRDLGTAVKALMGRQVRGKAVLHVES